MPHASAFSNYQTRELVPPAKWLRLFRTPGFQDLIERTVVHERFAIRFLLNLAVFVGGVEKLLDVLTIHFAGRAAYGLTGEP